MQKKLRLKIFSTIASSLIAISSVSASFADTANAVESIKNNDGTIPLVVMNENGEETDEAIALKGMSITEADEKFLLGISSLFNVFISGDFTALNSDVEGRVAIGGNFINKTWYNYQIGCGYDRYDTSKIDGTAHIIVQGENSEALAFDDGYKPWESKLSANDWTGGYKHPRTAVFGHSTNIYFDKYNDSLFSANSVQLSSIYRLEENNQLINFENEMSKLQKTSADLINKSTPNTSVYNENGTLVFKYNTQNNIIPPYIYFNIDSGTMQNASSVYFDVPNQSYVVVNVSGKNVRTFNQSFSSITNSNGAGEKPNLFFNDENGNKYHAENNTAQTARYLYNFYEAENLTIVNSMYASVLAPYADITGNDGHVSGVVIGKSFVGSTEIGYRPFLGPDEKETKQYNIKLSKFSADFNNTFNKTTLDNAVFQIIQTDENGNVIEKFGETSIVATWYSSNDNQSITLDAGTYVIREISAPDEYLKTEDIPLIISENNSQLTVTVGNTSFTYNDTANILTISGNDRLIDSSGFVYNNSNEKEFDIDVNSENAFNASYMVSDSEKYAFDDILNDNSCYKRFFNIYFNKQGCIYYPVIDIGIANERKPIETPVSETTSITSETSTSEFTTESTTESETTTLTSSETTTESRTSSETLTSTTESETTTSTEKTTTTATSPTESSTTKLTTTTATPTESSTTKITTTTATPTESSTTKLTTTTATPTESSTTKLTTTTATPTESSTTKVTTTTATPTESSTTKVTTTTATPTEISTTKLTTTTATPTESSSTKITTTTATPTESSTTKLTTTTATPTESSTTKLTTTTATPTESSTTKVTTTTATPTESSTTKVTTTTAIPTESSTTKATTTTATPTESSTTKLTTTTATSTESSTTKLTTTTATPTESTTTTTKTTTIPTESTTTTTETTTIPTESTTTTTETTTIPTESTTTTTETTTIPTESTTTTTETTTIPTESTTTTTETTIIPTESTTTTTETTTISTESTTTTTETTTIPTESTTTTTETTTIPTESTTTTTETTTIPTETIETSEEITSESESESEYIESETTEETTEEITETSETTTESEFLETTESETSISETTSESITSISDTETESESTTTTIITTITETSSDTTIKTSTSSAIIVTKQKTPSVTQKNNNIPPEKVKSVNAVPASPKTGDNGVFALSMLSAMSLVTLIISKRKK